MSSDQTFISMIKQSSVYIISTSGIVMWLSSILSHLSALFVASTEPWSKLSPTLQLHASCSASIDDIRIYTLIYDAIRVCFVDDLYRHDIMHEQKVHGGALIGVANKH